MNWEQIIKRNSSSFVNAVVDKLLTDEWISTEELFERSLKLRQANGRPYRNALSRRDLAITLIRLGLAETKGKKNNKFIRKKQ